VGNDQHTYGIHTDDEKGQHQFDFVKTSYAAPFLLKEQLTLASATEQ